MYRISTIAIFAFLSLVGCASDQPHVIKAEAGPEVDVKAGMATQIEMPNAARVQTVTVGNPSLVEVAKDSDIVNLTAKAGAAGETNLIVRSRDDSGDTKVYQYHVVVEAD